MTEHAKGLIETIDPSMDVRLITDAFISLETGLDDRVAYVEHGDTCSIEEPSGQ